MSGLSANLEKGEYREVLFWLLLLGSWQFLASPGIKNGIIGALVQWCSLSSRGLIWTA